MEQARLFIAIALSFLVFFVWQALFVKKEPVEQPQPTEKQTAATKTADAPKTPEQAVEKPVSEAPYSPPAPADSATPRKEAKMITVDAPLYQIKISEKGAAFRSFLLKEFREGAEENAPMKELISEKVPSGSVQVGFGGNTISELSEAIFSTGSSLDRLEVVDTPKKLSFQWVSPNGVVIEKTFQFFPDTYLIQLLVTIKNGSNHPIQDKMTLTLINALPEKSSRFGFEGPSALIGKKVQEVKPKDIPEKSLLSGEVKWVALQDRYFMGSIIPKNVDDAGMKLNMSPEKIVKTAYVHPAVKISPKTEQSFEFEVFFGPKSVRILSGIGRGLNKAVSFGMFDFIAKPCLWLMNFLYGFIPNYGVAIIILTILMKLLLWPLGTKSYKSMNEMKKLQPIMTEIREKYKGDKKRMNQEIMGLYKTYKINPMGGCLPMIAQIPVFFALYRMLYEAIELRHAPFFGWINDLSAPDRLFRFDFAVPFMEPPYGIPVLTLVMGGTMFLQQKMTPSPGDPSQAKMMMLMPVVFTFIFINFSSGLVLYWLINNILSISQQYYITKKLS